MTYVMLFTHQGIGKTVAWADLPPWTEPHTDCTSKGNL